MDSQERDARTFFGERVDAYRESASHGNVVELARMLAWLQPQGDALAVDVATGGGPTARALVAAGCRVIATDLTRAMLVPLQADLGARGGVIAADSHALPLRSGTADIVTCRIAAHHFMRLREAVAEMARVLKPGGVLYIFDLTSPADPEAARVVDHIERLRDPSHVASHAPSVWRDALARAQLDVECFAERTSTFELEPWITRARMARGRESEVRRTLETHSGDSLGGYGLTEQGAMRVLRVEILARRRV